MSSAPASRATLVALLVVLALGVFVAQAPFAAASLRLAGIGLLWWYVIVAGPVAAIGLTARALSAARRKSAGGEADRPPLEAFAPWLAPVVLLTVATRVYAGSVDAPVLVLGVVVASLIPFVTPPLVSAPKNVAGALAAVAGIGFCLWANLLAVADVAVALALPRTTTVAAAAATAALLTVGAPRGRGAGVVLVLAVAALSVPVVGMGVADGWPWTAWAAVTSRPSLAFGERSAGVVQGRDLAPATTLVFSESHRITARTPGVYRVTERDGDHLAIREWRLVAGDSLSLRPGDHLTVPAGVRVSFERGKRVPGTPPSGVAWADPPERGDLRQLPRWLGTLGALVLGAVVLVAPPRSRRAAGTRRPRARAIRALGWPALAVAATLIAAGWGLYSQYTGPDGALGPSPVGALFEVREIAPWGHRFPAVIAAVALATLFMIGARALRDRVVALVRSVRRPRPVAGRTVEFVWLALLGVATVLAAWPGDAWAVLLTGLGLAGAGWVAPVLANVGGRAEGLGSAVGGALFIGLVLGAARLPGWIEADTGMPVVLAALVGWGVARAAGRLEA